MIKKVVVILLLTIILISASYFILFIKEPETNDNDSISRTLSPTLTIGNPTNKSPTETLLPGSSDYQFNYLIVRPTEIIELYSNLEDKLTSSEARIKYGCQSLVSGGFYDTDFKHLGLFISDGHIITNPIESALFNGFFVISSSKKPMITSIQPADLGEIRLGVQSGPILFSQSQPVDIDSNSPDTARRIIATISGRGEIVFISLHTKNNPISGPTLQELPTILDKINATTSLNIVNAINLDGGAHSTFVTQSVSLSELATIGSFFCIKPN